MLNKSNINFYFINYFCLNKYKLFSKIYRITNKYVFNDLKRLVLYANRILNNSVTNNLQMCNML